MPRTFERGDLALQLCLPLRLFIEELFALGALVGALGALPLVLGAAGERLFGRYYGDASKIIRDPSKRLVVPESS